MQRYACSIAYIGTRFHGWQEQRHLPTVCGAVNAALDQLVGAGNHGGAVVSSRTDAGVHALCNTFHVDITRQPRFGRSSSGLESLAAAELVGGLNAHLAAADAGYDDDIRLLFAEAVDMDHHARFSAVGREYFYRIAPSTPKVSSSSSSSSSSSASSSFYGGGTTSLFEGSRAWQLKFSELDVGAMQAAAQSLVGTHDFSSFRGRDCVAASPVTTVTGVRVTRHAAPLCAVPPRLVRTPTTTPAQGLARPLEGGEESLPTPAILLSDDEEQQQHQQQQQQYHQPSVVLVEVAGRRFLHNMVRNLVGALVEVGRGKASPDDLPRILNARDRRCAPRKAPAHGLYLSRVLYGAKGEG